MWGIDDRGKRRGKQVMMLWLRERGNMCCVEIDIIGIGISVRGRLRRMVGCAMERRIYIIGSNVIL